MIDSHCHLAGEEFAPDLDEVVARARVAGLQRCLIIIAADDEEEVARVGTTQQAWPGSRYAVGVHPHHAHHFAASPEAAGALVDQRVTQLPLTVAVGEIGLDYHYDFSPRAVQEAVFREQLRVARRRHLPVVIHTREAEADTLRIIGEESGDELRGVFHCFTGDSDAATRCLSLDFYLSIPGIVTFPKSIPLQQAVRAIPLERLLIETDAPYLAPVPHRGKRNEPSFVVQTYEAVARLRSVDRGVLGRQLIANFDDLFRSRRAMTDGSELS